MLLALKIPCSPNPRAGCFCVAAAESSQTCTSARTPADTPLLRDLHSHTHELSKQAPGAACLFEGKEGAGAQEEGRLPRVLGRVHQVGRPLDLSPWHILQQGHVQVAGDVARRRYLVGPCTAPGWSGQLQHQRQHASSGCPDRAPLSFCLAGPCSIWRLCPLLCPNACVAVACLAALQQHVSAAEM